MANAPLADPSEMRQQARRAKVCQRPLQVYTVLQMGLQTEQGAIGEIFMHHDPPFGTKGALYRAFLIRQKPNTGPLWHGRTV